MIKRCIWLIFLLCLVVCLASCGKNNNDGSDGKLEPIPTVPSYSGNTVKGSPFVGSFHCSWSSVDHSPTDDSSWEGRISELNILEDGTFSMTFDSLAGGNTVIKATVSGTVAVKDDVATCTVTGRSIDRFFGSDVESFTLVLIDSNELRYRGDQQGMVGDRDIFSRN